MNRIEHGMKTFAGYTALLLAAFLAGCGGGGSIGGVADTVAPTVLTTAPTDMAIAVARNTNVTATFSEAMNAATITNASFTLKDGVTPVAGAVTYAGKIAVFNPTQASLSATTEYTATLSTAVKDVSGNSLAVAKTWTFTTGASDDITAPTVTSTAPADADTDVAVNTNITAVFDESMDASTLTTSTFTLKRGATPVAGTVSYVGTTAVFRPGSKLAVSTVYTATITTAVKDLAGNALAVAKTWSFTTAATVAAGPAPVVLGLAGDYAVLAKTKVSTTDTAGTLVTGNIGISPAAATYITGFTLILDGAGIPPACFSTSALVVGNVYAAVYNTGGCTTPANLTTAVGDMMIAYTDAAGRSLPDHTELGAGNISGMTLAPGLYKWGTGVLISSNVTLSGGPNDVYIFQVAGDLTMASGTSMLLPNGALPKNIFWQMGGGTGVAIGTTAHFDGVILAA
ncbi:MAG: ice-binding family protein, partial [Gallionellaceae bacterium]|nr:ice-binding family protein [Gallionellaceae bacterium]